MASTDPRRSIGSKVMALAKHVTNEIECHRRYGSNKDTKMLVGTVTNIHNRKTKTNRTSTFVTATYILGKEGVTKQATLNIRSVKVYQEPDEPVGGTTMAGAPVTAAIGGGGTPPSMTIAVPTTMAIATLATTPALDAPLLPIEGTTGIVERTTTAVAGGMILPQAVTTETGGAGVAATALPPATMTPTTLPTTVAHETEWHKDDIGTRNDMNGAVPYREWKIRIPGGHGTLGAGSDRIGALSRLEYFFLMFPKPFLPKICELTNRQLVIFNFRTTTVGEVLKLFGVWILGSCFRIEDSRRNLWKTTAPSKYVPAPNFGSTGMSRHRYDELFRCIRFGDQPSQRPNHMNTEQYRWLLVDEFVQAFNDWRASMFNPSDELCGDESFSQWYGLGGYWINDGLPQYVAIDRKPESGCEIQNLADGRSGIMLRLKLVKTAEEENSHLTEDDEGINHGTVVLKNLVSPWAHTDRIVCADSYFASVACANELKKVNLRFIGVVKTATKQYPMPFLSSLELENRGDYSGIVSKDPDGRPCLLAFVWMDRERRYFISTCSSLQQGEPYSRTRKRQIDTSDPNAPPERVELTVPQPRAAEIYYRTCGKIDQHNRHRQDTLNLEKTWGTMDWSKRVNMTIFAMIIVDTWLAYSQCRAERQETQKEFYRNLAEELIDNTYDRIGVATRRTADTPIAARARSAISPTTGEPRAGLGVHLTPTKRKVQNKEGVLTNIKVQNRCIVCKQFKSRHVCSTCFDETGKEIYICHSSTGRPCFSEHLDNELHPY